MKSGSTKRVFGLDIDGVVYPYHEAVYTYYQCYMGYNDSYNRFWTQYFPSLSEEEQDYIVSIPIPYDMMDPYPYALKFINKAMELGDEVYYLTSRDSSLERITRRYLRRHEFLFQDNLIMCKDKATECRRYDITDFIDDFTKHVNSVSLVCNAYLINKPWNVDNRKDYPVVSNMKEFFEIIFGG